MRRSRRISRKAVRKSNRRVVRKSKRRTNLKKRRINSKRRKKRTLKIKGGNPGSDSDDETRSLVGADADESSTWIPNPKFINITGKRKIKKSFGDEAFTDQIRAGQVSAGTKCLMLARGKPESDSKGKILILVCGDHPGDRGLVIINSTGKVLTRRGPTDKSYIEDCEGLPHQFLVHNWGRPLVGRRVFHESLRGLTPVDQLSERQRQAEAGWPGIVYEYRYSRLSKMYRILEGLNPDLVKYNEIGNISDIRDKAIEYIRAVLDPGKSIFSHFDNPDRWPFTEAMKLEIQGEIEGPFGASIGGM